jgi:putative colanic acid biosynthesis acetyltransferase WcaF
VSQLKLYIGYFLNHIFNDIITHIPVHFFRKTFLRLFNKNISSSAVILMHTRILNFWNVKIGDHSIINQYVVLDCRRYAIVIDNNVDVGPYTRIWTLAHDPNDEGHGVKGKEVVIKHHVWIASGVTVMPGVTIHEGAVAAANAVVTKDVPVLEIVAGIPAKKIGMRSNSLSYQINYTPIFE